MKPPFGDCDETPFLKCVKKCESLRDELNALSTQSVNRMMSIRMLKQKLRAANAALSEIADNKYDGQFCSEIARKALRQNQILTE